MRDRQPTVSELAAQAAALAAEQARVCAALASAAAAPSPPAPAAAVDDLLTPEQVAETLQVTRKQVYALRRRADWLPYVVPISPKVLRFKAGLLDMLRRKGLTP